MKKYKLTDEGKEIFKVILIEASIGLFAVMGFILTIIFGLLLYCYAI